MSVKLTDLITFFTGDLSGLNKDLETAESKTQSSAGNMAKAIGASIVAGATVAGAAIVGFGIDATQQFVSFQKQMNEVFTLLPGITQQGMDDMTGQVKDFAKQFGVLPEKVVPALYQALSAGVPANNVFKFLETAQKAAAGGVTDLKTSVNGISSVVNAYGADILSAGKASDLMFTTVRLGKTNFEELSASLFNVVPTAASLGLQFGNVTAALAAMTLQGVPTSVATTQLRQLLVELSQAGGKASKSFEDAAGVSFPAFISQGHNLQDALKVMEGAAKNSNVRIADLFSSVEAGNAALSLTGTGAKTFGDDLAAMSDSAGATDKAFGTMQTGLGASFDKIKATWAATMLDVGQKLAPLIEDSLPAFQAAVGTLGGVIVTTFGYIVLALHNLRSKWDEDWGGMRTTITDFTGEVPKQLSIFWAEVERLFNVGGTNIAGSWEFLWGYNLFSALTGFVTLVIAEVTELTRAINGIITAFYALFHGDWAGFWGGLYDTANAVTNDILNVIEYVFGPGVRDGIVGALTSAWDGMKDIWKKISDWWNSTFGSLPGLNLSVAPATNNLGVVNPANTPNNFKELTTPIYAPGQYQGVSGARSNTINVHQGAIVVNGVDDPQKNADVILKALISIHEGMNP